MISMRHNQSYLLTTKVHLGSCQTTIMALIYENNYFNYFRKKNIIIDGSQGPKPEATLQRCSENMQKITLRHGCSPKNLLHLFKTYFPKNTSGRLLLLNTPQEEE